MEFRTKLQLGDGVILTLMIVIATIVYFSINTLIETSKWVTES